MNANQHVTVTSALGRDALKLRSLRMNDALGRPFEIEAEFACKDFDLDYAALLGTGLGIHFTQPGGRQRHFHGVVTQLSLAGSSGRFAVYRACLRPWLWLLRHSVDSRIFQDKSVPEIVKTEVLRHRGFTDVDDQLTRSYAARDYCVQYGESDLDFVSRLLEEEGIYYFFRHDKDKHVLVLCDSAKAHRPAPHCDKVVYRPQSQAGVDLHEGMSEWHEQREVVPGGFVVRDHDFTKPRTKLAGSSSAPAKQAHAKLEQFEFPAGFQQPGQAEALARLRRQELQQAQRRFTGHGNPFELGVGHRFSLEQHLRKSLNCAYVVCSATHTIVSDEVEQGATEAAPSFSFESRFSAITADQPYTPPRVTPKPTMHGPQTALVTGRKGNEIDTDEYGRVKLRFHWDRSASADDKASCWVRVSQGSAGKQWGQMVLPRIGEEVIVDFLHGDPDQPIVTGRVYNAEQMPPYALPANASRSTMKSHSTPKGGDDNFNELRFEDKFGEEEIYVHAERDFLRVVENNDTLKVGFDKKKDGNQKIAIYNDQTVEVGSSGCQDGSQKLTVWKNREARLCNGDDRLAVDKGSRQVTIAKDDALTLKTGNASVKVDSGSYSIEAAKSITFKVGANSITIDTQGVTIKALQVKVEGQTRVKVEGLQVGIEAKTTLDLAGLMTNVDSKALLAMKGALVKIN